MEIRFGILGCGAIAAHHAQAIAMVPGAVLAGAADARPESARTFCEKYGILRYATILTVWFASSQSTSKPHTEARLRRR